MRARRYRSPVFDDDMVILMVVPPLPRMIRCYGCGGTTWLEDDTRDWLLERDGTRVRATQSWRCGDCGHRRHSRYTLDAEVA